MRDIATINSIELSSLCDNACPYCPASIQGQHRETGLMSMDTFDMALEWVAHFVKKGTQMELNLFGVGEPTLNPHVVEMVRKARHIMPLRLPVHFNTNGNTMTEELARDLKDAGITNIDITGHDPLSTARTIRIFKKVGIVGQVSVDFMTQPNNWAGQVDWFEPDYRYPCPWLHRGQIMVMSNGDITACCIDAFGKGIIGHISGNLEDMYLVPFEVCKGCHQDVPESMKLITRESVMRNAISSSAIEGVR